MLFHNSHLIQSRTPLLHDHTKSKRRSHALWDWNQNKNMKKSKRLVENNWTKYLNLSPSATSQDYMLFMPDCITTLETHFIEEISRGQQSTQAGGCISKNTYIKARWRCKYFVLTSPQWPAQWNLLMLYALIAIISLLCT